MNIQGKQLHQFHSIRETTLKGKKTGHRDRIARLTAPCPSHKKLKLFTNADANTGDSTIALPGLSPGELKIDPLVANSFL